MKEKCFCFLVSNPYYKYPISIGIDLVLSPSLVDVA